ncbi:MULTISPECIES: GNAT family N-acetyltransferase [Exiguobacterium]|uniref:GNAT family N-acetyltransferase n=1 Tax=Exiguobacterium TaxID=33986 RepID=UPI001CD55582|nr:GNAT family N-acetyltransferase [Exiguobacterium aestuarii]MCA0981575.1 GNAT family N-acetyltransferase [Exiguobacterium aestuarii]
MDSVFVSTTDARLIARLNRSIHEHHVRMNPTFFAEYEEEKMYEAFLTLMGRLNHHFMVMEVEATPVGYIWFEEKVSEATAFRQAVRTVYVHHISIDTIYQRKGYGRRMMEWIEQWALDHQFKSIELDYWMINSEAASFYDEVGFAPKRQIVMKTLGE